MKKTLIYLLMLTVLSSFVFGQLDVSISQTQPEPLEAGDFGEIWFKVQNQGYGAKVLNDVTIRVEPKDGVSLTNGESNIKNIGVLPIGQETVKFRFDISEEAREGENQIDVFVEQNGQGIKKELKVNVINDRPDLSVGQVSSFPTQIKPNDEDVQLKVDLVNLGEGAAYGTRVVLKDVPKGISASESYSKQALLGTLQTNGQAQANFFIDVAEDTPAGTYQATLEVTYKKSLKGSSKEQTVELPLEIVVQKTPLYIIEKVETIPQVLGQGTSKVKLLVTVKNIGEQEGEAVRLRVYTKSEQPFTFDIPSDYVAPKLAAGQSAQAALEFDISNNAALKEYQLDTQIKSIYEDEVLVNERKIVLNVTQEASSNTALFSIIGLLIVASIGGYYYYKRKNKPRANNKKLESTYKKEHLKQ